VSVRVRPAAPQTPMLFDLHVNDRGSWTVVAPVGELDLASAPRVRSEVLNILADGARCIVIDLGGVDFLDSLGAGLLIAIRKRVQGLGGELRLCRPEPHVVRVLALAGIDRVVAVFPTVEEAVGPVDDATVAVR